MFTDEEIVNLETKRDQMFEKIVDRRRKLNVSAFNEVVSKNGFSKDSFLEKIGGASEDLISYEAKQIVIELTSNDFLFSSSLGRVSSINSESGILDSVENFIFYLKYASDVLAITASSLKQISKKKKQDRSRAQDSSVFKWCNDKWGFLKHLATGGFCSWHAVGSIAFDIATLDNLAWYDLEWNAISNVLGFILFIVNVSQIAYFMFYFLKTKDLSVLKPIANKIISLSISLSCDVVKNLRHELENEIEMVCLVLCSLNAIFLGKKVWGGVLKCGLEHSKPGVSKLVEIIQEKQ